MAARAAARLRCTGEMRALSILVVFMEDTRVPSSAVLVAEAADTLRVADCFLVDDDGVCSDDEGGDANAADDAGGSVTVVTADAGDIVKDGDAGDIGSDADILVAFVKERADDGEVTVSGSSRRASLV